MTAPIPFEWTGDSFAPLPGHAKACDRAFVVGAVYRLVEEQERSAASHRHYFAQIRTVWENLPDELRQKHPTEDHLRKFALIMTGYSTSMDFPCASRAEALRWAPRIESQNEYAVVTVTDAIVTVTTAKTQNTRAMNKQEFQASKDAVLAYVSALIGTTPDALARNAGQAA